MSVVNAVSPNAIDLAGPTLAPNVVNSSLTSVGTLEDLTVTNPIIGTGTDLALSRTGASTYSTVQHLMNTALSSGRYTGGAISASGTANAVDVAAGTGFIRAADSDTATQTFFDWGASVALSVPSNTTRYIGVEYNSGTPQVVARTTDDWDLDTEFPLGVVCNEGGTRYISNIPWMTADNTTNIIERFDSISPVSRDNRSGGLILANTGTRNVTVSAGFLFSRMSEFSISAIDTSAAGTFDAYYRDGSGGWTKQSAQTQTNNTQYDNGTGTLASITALSYASRWFYLMTDGTLAMVYGRAEYVSLAAALNDSVPSSAPDRITKEGLLIGRFIYQASGASPASTQTAFGTSFTSSGVTSASDLSNGTTGSNKIVLDTSPTIITPTFTGTAAGAALTLSTTLAVTGQTTLSSGVAIMTTPTTQHALRIVADQTLAGTDQFCLVSDFTSSSSGTDSGTSVLVAARIGDGFTQAETIALRIAQGSKGAGSTITTNYGIKINPQVSGNTNYAIYTESGLVRFGDSVNLNSLTASTALALDGSKNIVSVTNIGTGNNVLAISPTITGTITVTNLAKTGLASGGTPQTIASADVTTTTLTKSDLIITGTTNFSRFEAAGLLDRTELYIKFTGALTIAHASAISGTLYGIRLPGSTGFTTSANDTLMLRLDLAGGFWYTFGRVLA